MDTPLLILKTLHVIGFVAWVGGLFYLVNVFVYHRKALENQSGTNTDIMTIFGRIEKGVYKRLCNPAMIITWVAGVLMIIFHGLEWFKNNLWMHHKLLLLILFTVFHLMTQIQIKKLGQQTYTMTLVQFKLFNAIPLLFLIAIVILAVFKNSNQVLSTIVIIGLSLAILYIFANVKVNRKRGRNSSLNDQNNE